MRDVKPLNPTDPGPFQKYLFSAACYVQVGECYRELLENWGRMNQAAESAGLQDQLTAIWQEAFERQLALGGAVLQHLGVDEAGNINASIRAVQNQASHAGMEAMQHLVHSLGAGQENPPDFAAFFHSWAVACDKAYADLVRTEDFAKIFALGVNACIERGSPGRDQ